MSLIQIKNLSFRYDNGIENIFDDFNDDVIAYHNGKRYGEKIAFRSKEACQKYCDWLNKENK